MGIGPRRSLCTRSQKVHICILSKNLLIGGGGNRGTLRCLAAKKLSYQIIPKTFKSIQSCTFTEYLISWHLRQLIFVCLHRILTTFEAYDLSFEIWFVVSRVYGFNNKGGRFYVDMLMSRIMGYSHLGIWFSMEP